MDFGTNEFVASIAGRQEEINPEFAELAREALKGHEGRKPRPEWMSPSSSLSYIQLYIGEEEASG